MHSISSFLTLQIRPVRENGFVQNVQAVLEIRVRWIASVLGIMARVMVWKSVDECIDEGSNLRVLWTKAHTTHEEKAQMTNEDRQVAWSNERADKTVQKW